MIAGGGEIERITIRSRDARPLDPRSKPGRSDARQVLYFSGYCHGFAGAVDFLVCCQGYLDIALLHIEGILCRRNRLSGAGSQASLKVELSCHAEGADGVVHISDYALHQIGRPVGLP